MVLQIIFFIWIKLKESKVLFYLRDHYFGKKISKEDKIQIDRFFNQKQLDFHYNFVHVIDIIIAYLLFVKVHLKLRVKLVQKEYENLGLLLPVKPWDKCWDRPITYLINYI